MAGSPDHFHHVRDFPHFELPFGGSIGLPKFHIPVYGDFQLTKFMVLQLIAAVLTLVIFAGLSKRVGSGRLTKGRFWNFWEALALFIRDEVVRPTIGEEHHAHGHDDHSHGEHGHHHEKKALSGHHSDKYLPFIWSCFFFVLFCNLLGAVPLMGSPTASICVTGVLACSVFVYNVFNGSKQFGFVGFWKNQLPNLGLTGAMGVGIGLGMWCIEVLGLFIKHGVLAVRLFANMMGGHTVVGVILGFIAMQEVSNSMLAAVIPGSILGQVFIGLLELFVAFLQAYVFALLATMFLSASLHSH